MACYRIHTPKKTKAYSITRQNHQVKTWKYFEILTFKSPEIFAPAKIPVAAGKKIENVEKKVSPRKSGPIFSTKVGPAMKTKKLCISQ